MLRFSSCHGAKVTYILLILFLLRYKMMCKSILNGEMIDVAKLSNRSRQSNS